MYWGLRAQNHRGHQSHGFLTFDTKFHVYKSLDLVPRLKNEAIHEWFDRLPGSVGIGNVRYTTSGKCDDTSIIEGTQPVYASAGGIKLALSFNGNIVNTLPLKKEMTENFSDFYFNCDSDVVCHKLLLGLKTGQRPGVCGSSCHGKPRRRILRNGINRRRRLLRLQRPAWNKTPLRRTRPANRNPRVLL